MRINGRIPYIDSNNPDAWGRCDLTGLPVMYSDLRPQMEYIGETLQWTGLMVNKKDLDEPNPQLIPPRLKPDPLPVRNPRYFPLPKQPGIPTGLMLDPTVNPNVTSTAISIRWNPVIATPGSGIVPASQYTVYWQSSSESLSSLQNISGNPVPQPPQPPFVPITGVTYQIQDLMPSTTYLISVASMNNFVYELDEDGNPTTIALSYNLSSPSYGPPSNTYSGRVVPNPYAFLSVTTLTS